MPDFSGMPTRAMNCEDRNFSVFGSFPKTAGSEHKKGSQ
jgi:hypothetical protein